MEQTGSTGGSALLTSMPWGATKKEWALFAAHLKLLPELLPVVSNPNAIISANSKIKKAGKLPSIYNTKKELAGIAKWTDKTSTVGDLKTWMAQPDYGICVQTRNVRAIDVDVADAEKAASIGKVIGKLLGDLPVRGRSNTHRFLVVFQLEGDFTKRYMGKSEDDNLVEFLATGQQFIAAGTHPTGVRYTWSDNISKGIPTVTAEQFEAAWAAISVHHLGIVPLPPAKAKKLEINNDLTGGQEYPPSSAIKIAEKCAQIKFFSETGSDNETHWRNCLSIPKHCIEGEELAHIWSQNSADYDVAECQSKLDKWTTGPAKCATFQNYGDLCRSCKFLGHFTTPMQLGYTEKSGEVTVEADFVTVDDEDEDSPKSTETTLNLPKPFCLYGSQLTYQKEIDGVTKYIKVSDILFYLQDRIRNIEGTTSYIVKARIRKSTDTWAWTTFEVPASVAGSGGQEMFKALAAYEIVPLPGGKEYMETYVKAYMDDLRRKKEEINSYRTFGWCGDKFVFGGDLMAPNEPPRKVVIGGTLAPGFLCTFDNNSKQAADAVKWAALMKQAYDHPSHEHYQMVLAAGFGSVLANFSEINMGGPIALFGGKGKGKTTVCKMALSIWGDPEKMMISDPVDGSTTNAWYARMSAMHSLPWLVDEVTKLTGIALSSFAYHMANAQPKDALTKERKRVEPLPPWCDMGFMTSNDSPNEKIAAGLEDSSAQMSRLLEVEWNNKVKTITMHEMDEILEQVEPLQGAAGWVFMQYLIDHQAEVKAFMRGIRRKLDNEIGLTKELRFWSVQAMCMLAGGVLAHKLGLFPFSVKMLAHTIREVMLLNMGNIIDRTSTPIEAFHNMLTSFSPATISTQTEGDGRASEMRVEVRCIGEPVARVVRETGVIYVSTPAIREWCSKRQIGYNQMKKDLQDEGILLTSHEKFVIGKGTTVSTGQIYCWKLDWNKVQGITDSKISHLKLVDTAQAAV